MIFLYLPIHLIDLSGKCTVNIPVHRSFWVGDLLCGKNFWLATTLLEANIALENPQLEDEFQR